MSGNVGVRTRVNPAKLAKFKKAFRLKDLTKKAGTVGGTMPPAIVKSLDERINAGDLTERARIKELLHFSAKEAKGSTEAARADIRSILANTLGRGISLDAAEQLRPALEGAPKAKLAAIVADLNDDGAFAPAVLIEHLLNNKSKTAQRDYAALKDTLTAFPGNPSRAGQVEVSKNNITIGRDEKGDLKILSQAMTFVPLQVPPENQGLTPEKIEGLKTAFKSTVDVNYSRGGVALEFMSSIRKENTKGRSALLRRRVDIGEALGKFDADGEKAATKYGGGDCMTQAEKLVAELKKQGISAQVVGLMEDKHVQQSRDQDKQIPFDKAAQIAGGMTHTDVVIPYTDTDGNRRVLMFVPGMGKQEDTDEQLLFDEAAEDFLRMDGFRRVIGPDGNDLDTSSMQKRQLGFMTNIMITANKPEDEQSKKDMCGLDLVRGKLWLNGNATKKVKAPKGMKGKVEGWGENAKGSIEVDLKQMLRNPKEKLKIEVWNERTGDYEEVEVTKIEALTAGLIAIGKQFGQPPDFVDNILTLGENLDDYRAKVIHPDIMDMHK